MGIKIDISAETSLSDDDHESSVFFRLGAPAERADRTIVVSDDAVVGPDGVMWVTIGQKGDGRPRHRERRT
jgi:sugar lactone lactonase YvrE